MIYNFKIFIQKLFLKFLFENYFEFFIKKIQQSYSLNIFRNEFEQLMDNDRLL